MSDYQDRTWNFPARVMYFIPLKGLNFCWSDVNVYNTQQETQCISEVFTSVHLIEQWTGVLQLELQVRHYLAVYVQSADFESRHCQLGYLELHHDCRVTFGGFPRCHCHLHIEVTTASQGNIQYQGEVIPSNHEWEEGTPELDWLGHSHVPLCINPLKHPERSIPDLRSRSQTCTFVSVACQSVREETHREYMEGPYQECLTFHVTVRLTGSQLGIPSAVRRHNIFLLSQTKSPICIQLKLRTRDTMGATVLSLVERSRPYLGGQVWGKFTHKCWQG